jgi:hypothetical protein
VPESAPPHIPPGGAGPSTTSTDPSTEEKENAMGLFSRKTVSSARNGGAYFDENGIFVDPGARRNTWECARCGDSNPSAAPACGGCGAVAGLAAIR